MIKGWRVKPEWLTYRLKLEDQMLLKKRIEAINKNIDIAETALGMKPEAETKPLVN